jgi:hypothetical protein
MKIELIHPITHDGTEFGRGMHDLPIELVQQFVNHAPHAVRSPQQMRTGTTAKAPDADAALSNRLLSKSNAGL